MCDQCRVSRRRFLRGTGLALVGAATSSLLLACGGQQAAGDAADHGEAPHWEYTGATGTRNWSKLSADYMPCRAGQSQSPIDIVGIQAQHSSTLSPLEINYQPTPVTLLNNGHTVQVNYTPGSTLTFQGTTFELKQFHFHNPSEHTINGEPFAMELHLVHADNAGSLAVIGVLLQAGAENLVLAPFWGELPRREGEVMLNQQVDIASILPADGHYYTYNGSLTTPPCSESVTWIVMQTPVQMSAQQVAHYGAFLGHTARPVQPLHGRAIEAF